jgi:hypothetical protein
MAGFITKANNCVWYGLECLLVKIMEILSSEQKKFFIKFFLPFYNYILQYFIFL